MILQTHIPIQKETYHPIEYTSKIQCLGSCFSTNIGNKFAYFKFQSNQNPFGILFHPKAIETLITNAINLKVYTEKDLFFLNECWHCFDAHSSLSDPNKENVLMKLNTAITSLHEQLHHATHICITLGTSWAYRYIASDTLVGNCHKVPQKKFGKELLTVDSITESLEKTLALIRSINPKASLLFTVSPVRHLKDGFVENQQSKAHLIAAVHNVIDPRNNVHYFPSYEILLDELRDYRFYAEDMIHPNQTAINYIWERFSETWISKDATTTMQAVETIQRGLNHRPFNENSAQHQLFLKNLQNKIDALKEAHPHMKFDYFL